MKLTAILIIAATISGAGCASILNNPIGGGTATTLNVSSALPASQGTVRFASTKNDNTKINLVVKHLANPERLTPPKQNYVVWIQRPNGGPAQNIGALKVDKDLTGNLQTEVPLHVFKLFITAENSGEVQQPTGSPLLWGDYAR